MDRDRNLLFGAFAVQLGKVTPAQLVKAAEAWAARPDDGLAERLINGGALSPQDSELVWRLVDEAVRAHGGDCAATLINLGGDRFVRHAYRGSLSLAPDGVVAPTLDTAGTAVALEADDIPALQETPGRYSHVSEHARGGMGRILIVHDAYIGRDIALKELVPGAGSDSSSDNSPMRVTSSHVARFLLEARVAGQLEHPSIVPVYELGYRPDGTLYYTMKLVRGRTLFEAIRDAGSLADRLELLPHFVDLCQAVAYAHSRGVIHRDIKPQNVMVGEFGETVVLDWGLAKAPGHADVHLADLAETLRAFNLHDEAGAETLYGHAIGTPAYMPPEQARGELDRVDERSDVYSLGAVLYELLNGRPPFTGQDVHEIVSRVAAVTPHHQFDFDPDAPGELVAVCRKALSPDPDERCQGAAGMARDVQSFLSGALVEAYRYTPIDHLRRFARHYRNVLATAAMALLLAGAFLVYFDYKLIQWRNAERTQRIAAQQALIAARDAQQQELAWRRRFFAGQAEAFRRDYEAIRLEEEEPSRTVRLQLIPARLDTRLPGLSDFAARLNGVLDQLFAGLHQTALTRLPPASADPPAGRPGFGPVLQVRLAEQDNIVEVRGLLQQPGESGILARRIIRWDHRLPNAAEDIGAGLVAWAVQAARTTQDRPMDRLALAIEPVSGLAAEEAEELRSALVRAMADLGRFRVVEGTDALANARPAPAQLTLKPTVRFNGDGAVLAIQVSDADTGTVEMTATEPLIAGTPDEADYAQPARRAAEAVAARFPQATGEVTEVTGSSAYADIGRRDGVRTNALVGIYRIEPPVVDDQTGEVLRGRHVSLVAHGRVTEVQETSARIEVAADSGEKPPTLEPGMIAHVL